MVGDCALRPLTLAVSEVEPGAMAVIRIVAVDEPPATMTDVSTVATDGLLLESVTAKPPAGATPLSVTVPKSVLPTATVAPVRVMVETVVVGAVGELE
jgi:hypothetical protein